MSVRRSAASFGLATVLSHTSQLIWLAAGIRIMSAADFGSVLAAQALYAVLQVVVDVGTNGVGARMAARGELDDRRRGEIVRVRFVLALASTPLAIALGLLGFSGSLAATLPFVVALWLFAALNVWEPYGAGDARPWATYTFLRSVVLAAVAVAFVLAGGRFPVPLAGTLECLAIVIVAATFGPRPLLRGRLAIGCRGGPWRSVFAIGGPAFAAQSSMAAGTLVLSGSGNPARAGTFAACVRLLSGINAICGVVATSLYPRLARGAADGSAGDRRVVTVALGLIAVLGAGATMVCVLFARPIGDAFLGQSSSAAVAALVLTIAASLPLGNLVMFNSVMIARRRERATLRPFLLGGLLTAGLAVLAVAAVGPRVEIVGASLLIGQTVTMAALGLRLHAACPDLAAATRRSMGIALLVGVVAGASLLPGAAVPSGLVLLLLVGALLAALRPFAASLRGDLARWRRRRAAPLGELDESP